MKYLHIIFIISLISSCDTFEKTEKKLPNIIIILADDLGYGDVGAFNANSKIKTPNIDQLAETGMMFTNAHSPGNWCTPSRYGLLTGRYPFRVDISKMSQSSLIEENQETLGTLLKKKGYVTGCVGKWHLGFDNTNSLDYSNSITNGPVDKGFDYYYGIYASLDIPPYYIIENNKVVQAPTDTINDNYSDDWTKVQGAFWRGGNSAPNFKHEEILPDFESKALNFIAENGKGDNPFFLYFPLTAPHTPWLPNGSFKGKSEAGMYGDFTEMVDHLVGNITAKLQDMDIEDETLIIFTSDNGPVWFQQDIEKYNHNSTGPYRGLKADLWEGAHHVPFIVKWPGIVKNRSMSDKTICFTDFMATFADITNLKLTGQFDSHSLLPILKGNENDFTRNETVIMENILLKDNYKLIKRTPNGWLNTQFSINNNRLPNYKDSIGLYNLKLDKGETHNLASIEKTVLDKLIHSLDSVISTAN